MMGASVFPERYLRLVVIAACRADSDASEWTTTGLAKFIGPASANVLGGANAIASAIVVSFMDVPFSFR